MNRTVNAVMSAAVFAVMIESVRAKAFVLWKVHT